MRVINVKLVSFKMCFEVHDEEENLPYSTETLETLERVVAAVIGNGVAVGNISLSATSEIESEVEK